MSAATKMIGVLSLQGDFAEHAAALASLGAAYKFVRKPQELDNCSGLIIPGGESSAMLKLMQPWGFLEKIKAFHASGGYIFGTCAGMILLAQQVTPQQASLGLINITVQRNAYGRQLESKTILASKTASVLQTDKLAMTLIRAPRITNIDSEVNTLAWDGATPMLVAQGRVLAASFHPEMSMGTQPNNCAVMKYFISMCAQRV